MKVLVFFIYTVSNLNFLDFKNSLTRDLKINLFSKSPSFKTESKDKFIQCGLKQKNNKTNEQLDNKQKFMNNLTKF